MKRLFVLFFAGLLACLVSCGTVSKPQEEYRGDQMQAVVLSQTLDENDAVQLDIPGSARTVFFGDLEVLYLLDTTQQTQTLYMYEVETGESVPLTDLEGDDMVSGRIASGQRVVYIPCRLSNEQNRILAVDLESRTVDVLYEWMGDVVCCDLYLTEETLVVFQIRFAGDEKTEYVIGRIDQDEKQYRQLVNEEYRYESQCGTGINCIVACGTEIYALAKEHRGDQHDCFWITYDLEGTQLKKIYIDLSQVETPQDDDEEGGNDVVVDMYSGQSYFAMNTLNGRGVIYQIVKSGELEALPVPEELAGYGYRIIDCGDIPTDFICFATTFQMQNDLYIFDCQTAQFTEVALPFDGGGTNHYYCNRKGDILLQRTEKEQTDSLFYCLSVGK